MGKRWESFVEAKSSLAVARAQLDLVDQSVDGDIDSGVAGQSQRLLEYADLFDGLRSTHSAGESTSI